MLHIFLGFSKIHTTNAHPFNYIVAFTPSLAQINVQSFKLNQLQNLLQSPLLIKNTNPSQKMILYNINHLLCIFKLYKINDAIRLLDLGINNNDNCIISNS